jgi:hypothetical protein|tara:strand:+ start:156 stop:380 length:225 start_codon:yes stop_codon:yes gene_type:complete
MNQLLSELMINAENNSHCITFEIDPTKRLKIVAPFNMRIIGDIGTAYVNARTRQEAIQIVLDSGVPVKQFVELQ